MRRLLNLQPGEGRKTVLLYSLHFVFYVGLAWGGAASMGLFMSTWGANSYRYILIGDALLAFVLGLVFTSFADRVSNANLLIALSLIVGVCLSAIRVALGAGPGSTSLVYPALLLLFRVFRRLFTLQILNYINDFYDTRAAKRALPLMTSAVVAATALGGAVIGPMISLLGVGNVVLGWAVCLLLVVVLVFVCERLLGQERQAQMALEGEGSARAETETPRHKNNLDNLRDGFRFVKSSRFLMLLAGATLAMALINNLFTFQTGWAVAQQFPRAEDQTTFYGVLDGISSLLSLVIQVLLLGRLIGWVGVSITNLIFPFTSLLLYGFLGLNPNIYSAIGGRLNNSAIKEAFNTPTDAMLYNSVPVQVKGRAKAFINGILVPISVLVAGGLLFLVPSGSPLRGWLAGLAIGAIVLYALLSLGLRSEYSKALVRMLEEEDFTLYRLAMAELNMPDARTFEQFIQRLETSTDDDLTIFMAEIAVQVGGQRAMPSLQKLITSGSPRVRSTVLDVLSKADFAGAEARALCVDCLSDESSAVRRAAIVALGRLSGSDDEEFLSHALKLLDDPALEVHVQVLPPLIQSGDFFYLAAAVEALGRLLKSQDGDRRTVGVHILGSLDDVRFLRTLIVYLRDSSGEVRRQAAAAMEHLTTFDVPSSIAPLVLISAQRMLRDPIEHVRLAGVTTFSQLGMHERAAPVLLTSLSDNSRRVRERAVEALQGMGPVVVPTLEAALRRAESDEYLQETIGIVLARIERERFEPLITGQIEYNLFAGNQTLSALQTLESLPLSQGVFLLKETLQEYNDQRLARIFDLIAAIRPPESVQVVVDHLRNPLARVQANAVEALESLTSPRTAQVVAAMARIQTETTEELAERAHESPRQVFEDYSRGDDVWLQAVAIYTLGEVGLEWFSQDELEHIFDRCCGESQDRGVQEACRIARSRLYERAALPTDGGEETSMLSTIERVIFLKQVHFFEGMTIGQLRILAGVSEERTFARGEVIFEEGDTGDTLYIVVRGSVAIERSAERSESVVRLATFTSGQYFGEMSIFDEEPRSATAVSLELSLLLSLRRGPLMALIQENPDMSLELIRVLSSRLRDVNRRLAEAARGRPRVLQKVYDELSE
jgi:CRP-like cAMP-binding protein